MSGTILVTGGAGFIGSNFVRRHLRSSNDRIVVLDKLTYAGRLENLQNLDRPESLAFVHGDIGDSNLVRKILADHAPRAVLNFAAESHVDRSIDGPEEFIRTNVLATCRLLQVSLEYFKGLGAADQARFRFLHVSTDEVYGSLGETDPAFSETTAYAPNSPYSASKAASDHLVRAWHHTYGMPTLTTNCSNNYGPYQFPEKLIPLLIQRCLRGEALPIYGDGLNVRDWLFVEDHCEAIDVVLEGGRTGETYNIGGDSEVNNIRVATAICEILDAERPRPDGSSYANLISFVEDRPGHDRRYAIDARKIHDELGWRPTTSFDAGLRHTIRWYLENDGWMKSVTKPQGGAAAIPNEFREGKS